MGYNLTIGPPRRMEDYLKKLLHRKETIRFATDDPHSLAYKLREAIAASAEHERFIQYAKLKDMYKFRNQGDHVLAEYQRTFPQERVDGKDLAPELDEDDDAPEAPEPEPGPSEMEVPEAESLTEVVSFVLERGGQYSELIFPNATLMTPHLRRLHGFTKDRDWSIIERGEEGITLTRREVPEEITWTPEEDS